MKENSSIDVQFDRGVMVNFEPGEYMGKIFFPRATQVASKIR